MLDMKTARKSVNLTQEALADKIGVNRATVSKYENGEIIPPLTQLKKLSEVFKLGCGLTKDNKLYFYPYVDPTETLQNSIIDIPNSTEYNSDYINNAEKKDKFNLQLFATDTSVSDKIFAQIDKLNDVGLQKALEQIELLTKIQEYLK